MTLAVGAYPVRVRTAGLVSPTCRFSPSATCPKFPPNMEPNDSIAEAQPVNIPGAISGTLKGPDQDFFSFTRDGPPTVGD